MNTEKPENVVTAQRTFYCSICGKEAGKVTLYQTGALVRNSFVSELKMGTGAEKYETVRQAIDHGDIKTIHAFDFEVSSFYCPKCDACYCSEHWDYWNEFSNDDGFSWHEGIRGRCPRDHTRLLED